MSDDDVAARDLRDLAQAVADQAASFLLAVREIARNGERSTAVPLLLLEVSQLLLGGARLAVNADFVPRDEYEPDVGPDPDLDDMRIRLAALLEGADDYTEVFDPYMDPPELVVSRISDDIAGIASSVAHGLRHFRSGHLGEALWWWQFSYVSNWGAEASAALRALQSVIAHDRLDASRVSAREAERVAAAEGFDDA